MFSIFQLGNRFFWKTKTFFKKLENQFLVESSKTENASFPYKTAISEASVKTNRKVSTKGTYQQSFASNYSIFLKKSFQHNKLLQRVDLMYQPLKCPYSHFLPALKFWWCFFPASVLNYKNYLPLLFPRKCVNFVNKNFCLADIRVTAVFLHNFIIVIKRAMAAKWWFSF